MHGYTYADNNPLTYSDPAGTEIGSRPNSCQYSLANCDKKTQQDVGYDPRTGTTDYRRGNIYKKQQKSKKTWVADNTPVTNDIDKLSDYWASAMDGEFTDDFWENPVYESEKQGSACYGRKGCRQAYLYVLHGGNDVEKAKELAAAYCAHHPKTCAEKAREVARGRAIEEFVNTAFISYLGVAASLEGNPCNSFVPGTQVLMADGTTKSIEDIETGDRIVATDPESGRTEAKTVTAEITGKGLKHLVKITLTVDGNEKGESRPHTVSLTATDGHPFWVPQLHRWIDATNLQVNEQLRTPTGTLIRVTALARWTTPATVHNLTVADLHTYYVVAGETPVLVHNSPRCSTAINLGPRPAGVGDDWVGRGADNGKGIVWQKPGSPGNADMVRVMDPTGRYPNGYVRFHNKSGQPIGLNGKPGSKADTHIPMNPDGTYPLPMGW